MRFWMRTRINVNPNRLCLYVSIYLGTFNISGIVHPTFLSLSARYLHVQPKESSRVRRRRRDAVWTPLRGIFSAGGTHCREISFRHDGSVVLTPHSITQHISPRSMAEIRIFFENPTCSTRCSCASIIFPF